MKKRVLFVCSLSLIALLAVTGGAYAAAAPAPPEPLGWMEYLGIGLAALGGIKVIVDVLLAGFTWLAPRTKTTADDTIRDDLKLAHDKIDALTALVQGIVPNAKPQTGGAS